MHRYLIIVARARSRLFETLHERHRHEALVVRDRRKAPRPGARTAGLWSTDLNRDGYMVVPLSQALAWLGSGTYVAAGDGTFA